MLWTSLIILLAINLSCLVLEITILIWSLLILPKESYSTFSFSLDSIFSYKPLFSFKVISSS